MLTFRSYFAVPYDSCDIVLFWLDDGLLFSQRCSMTCEYISESVVNMRRENDRLRMRELKQCGKSCILILRPCTRIFNITSQFLIVIKFNIDSYGWKAFGRYIDRIRLILSHRAFHTINWMLRRHDIYYNSRHISQWNRIFYIEMVLLIIYIGRLEKDSEKVCRAINMNIFLTELLTTLLENQRRKRYRNE